MSTTTDTEAAVANCDKCGGKIIKSDGEYQCLNCGELWRSTAQKRDFFDSHKIEILKDVAVMGRTAAADKWRTSSGSLHGILKRWIGGTADAPLVTPAASIVVEIPEFPVFDNTWSDEVKLAWFDIYSVIIKAKRRAKNGSKQNDQGD